MGRQYCATTSEDGLAVFYKAKIVVPCNPEIMLLGMHANGLKITPTLKAAHKRLEYDIMYNIITQTWKQLKYLLIDE